MVHVQDPHFSKVGGDYWSMDEAAPETFYELLGLPTGASVDDIRGAYRKLQRVVHPDIVGPSAHALAILLNVAVATLSDPNSRAAYDAELAQYLRGVGVYDGRPISSWCGSRDETRAIFVDECTCIGCMQCTYSAQNTFFMEDEWGRARVSNQWADDEECVKEAVSSCPVDAIHYVPRDHLPLLEFVMKSCQRENVSTMARRRSGNMGSPPSGGNPFHRAELFLKLRRDIKVAEEQSGGRVQRMQDEHLAASIAQAWLHLPREARTKAWPTWSTSAVRIR